MGYTSMSIEDSDVESDLNCGGLAQEEMCFSVLPRDHSCEIWVKIVAAFCSGLKSLPEAKVKSFG